MNKKWFVWTARRKLEAWHLAKDNKAPDVLSKDRVGSPEGRVFRRAQTHICWKHYRHIWSRFGSNRVVCVFLGDSPQPSMAPDLKFFFLAISSCSFQPLDLLGCSLHLVREDTKSRNKGSHPVSSGCSHMHCCYCEMCTCSPGVLPDLSRWTMHGFPVPWARPWPHPQQSWSPLSQVTTWWV